MLFSGQLSQASKQHMASAIQWAVAIKQHSEEYSELSSTEAARFGEILSSSNMRLIDANKNKQLCFVSITNNTAQNKVHPQFMFQHYWKSANDSTQLVKQDFRLYQKNAVKIMVSNENSMEIWFNIV